MNKPFKPMLAAAVEDVSALTFPLIASPKLDGIRCIVRNGVAYSRSNKPIRNRYIQQCVSEYSSDLEGLDGELIVGSPTACDVYRVTNSAVMSADGTPDFKFFVFDRINREGFADSLRHFQYHALLMQTIYGRTWLKSESGTTTSCNICAATSAWLF